MIGDLEVDEGGRTVVYRGCACYGSSSCDKEKCM